MGCFPSKPPATAARSLFRRRDSLRQTISRRSSLAAAHAAYFRSLAALADALLHFARSLDAPPAPDVSAHLQISSSSDSDTDSKCPNPNPNPNPNCSYMRTSGSSVKVVYEDANYVNDLNFYYGWSVNPNPAERANEGDSGWDFWDPFSAYEGFLPGGGAGSAGSGESWGEVRAREGIPDLEDENGGVVGVEKGKEVVEDCSGVGGGVKIVEAKEAAEEVEKKVEEVEKRERKGEGLEKKGRKVGDGGKGGNGSCSGKELGSEKKGGIFEEGRSGLGGGEGSRDVLEALGSVREEFRVAVFGSEEVSRLLEVGRMACKARNRVFRGWFFGFFYLYLFGFCNEHDVVREIDSFM